MAPYRHLALHTGFQTFRPYLVPIGFPCSSCVTTSTSYSLIRIRNHKKREVDLSHQISHNAEPFRIEWLSADGLACSTVPVGCVVLIAFFAMQVGVHPRTIGAFVPLSRFVGRSEERRVGKECRSRWS